MQLFTDNFSGVIPSYHLSAQLVKWKRAGIVQSAHMLQLAPGLFRAADFDRAGNWIGVQNVSPMCERF